MVGCCAWGCSNRLENGYKMFRFPRNKTQSKIWEVKISRKAWTPTPSSYLCEVHFDQSQFETGRADGKRKLKLNAVPTIFPHRKAVRHRKSPKIRGNMRDITKPGVSTKHADHTYCLTTLQSDSSGSESKSEVEDGEMDSDLGAEETHVFQNEETEVGKQQKPKKSESKHNTEKLHAKIGKLKASLKKTRRELRVIKRKKLKQNARFLHIFGRDQFDVISRGSSRGLHWSNQTIKKALELRFSCGASGYQVLLKQQYPLPSNRTLQRRMENVPFQPGILHQVFQYLSLKVKSMTEQEKVCCLTLDEMSLTPGIQYDVKQGNLVGTVTLPNHSGNANHALVFMLGGITSRWKQSVPYHFTSNSVDGAVLKDIVLELIKQATLIGLHVIAVTSDMGSANRAMWRSFGVVTGRHCESKTRIPHPQVEGKWLHFLADVPHLLKNVKACLISGQTFTLPDAIVAKYNLPCHEASIKPLHDLAQFQQKIDLKLAPKLDMAALTPSHFDKMKVSNATKVISQDVSSAIKYLIEKEGHSEANFTTAWFIELLSKWFSLMTSRHPVLGLSRMHPVKYEEARTFLLEVVSLFKAMKVGERGEWKPIQSGVILATTSVLNIAEELLDGNHKFLLTARLTQDCLENLFSVVRLRKPVPLPPEFMYALKVITIAQFLKHSRKGSYHQDDGEFLAEFLNVPLTDTHEDTEIEYLQLSDESMQSGEIQRAEQDSLYHLAGYCVYSVRKGHSCVGCTDAMIDNSVVRSEASRLTELKEFKKGSLVRVSKKLFDMLVIAESIFRRLEDGLVDGQNLKSSLLEVCKKETGDIQLASCHNLKEKILSKFISVRLQIYCKKRRDELKQTFCKKKKGGELGSKSMAMRTLEKGLSKPYYSNFCCIQWT